MKQYLVPMAAIAVALCVHPAQAETAPVPSSVQLFGRLDVGLASFKGIQDGTTHTLSSGLTATSTVGVRGQEDLGGGHRIIFRLEHGLHADGGTVSQPDPLSGRRVPLYLTRGLPAPAATLMDEFLGDYLIAKIQQPFWGKQTYVGWITPVGAVLAGRLVTPVFELLDRFDPMESGTIANGFALLAAPEGMEIRASRSLQYRIEAGGWSGALSWSGASDAGLTSTGRFIGAQVGYETPRYSVGVGHQDRRNAQGQRELSNTLLGGWWQIDKVRLMGSVLTARNPNPDVGLALMNDTRGLSDVPEVQAAIDAAARQVNQQLTVDIRMWSLGLQYRPAPQWRLMANVATMNERKLTGGQAQLLGAAMEFSLSPRTAVWTAVSHIDNGPEQQVAPVTSGGLMGFAARPGQATSALQVNLSHRF